MRTHSSNRRPRIRYFANSPNASSSIVAPLLSEVPGTRTEGFLGLHEVLHIALQLELVVARLRRRGRRRRLVRRDLDVAVILEAGACRDQPAHRDVLLQTAQVIDLAG